MSILKCLSSLVKRALLLFVFPSVKIMTTFFVIPVYKRYSKRAIQSGNSGRSRHLSLAAKNSTLGKQLARVWKLVSVLFTTNSVWQPRTARRKSVRHKGVYTLRSVSVPVVHRLKKEAKNHTFRSKQHKCIYILKLVSVLLFIDWIYQRNKQQQKSNPTWIPHTNI